MTRASARRIDCPSAQPDMDDAAVLGVVEMHGADRQLAYLNSHVPATEDVLAQTGQVPPTEVLRFSAGCSGQKCHHFDGTHCTLVTRVLEGLAPVVSHPPACRIRKTCRWHLQHGAEVCRRCPQVVTHISRDDAELLRVAGYPSGPSGPVMPPEARAKPG